MGDASKKSKRRRGAPVPPRPEGRVYRLTPEVQALLEEVKRLFPRSGDVVRFADLPPGCESVETVSQQLLDELRRSFDQERFMVFCRLNAERLLDCIQQRIDEGAWPLDAQELLAEVYFRLHDDLLFRAGILPARRTAYEWTEPSGPSGTYELLRGAVDALLEEQLRLLRARTIPLPGIPSPAVAAGDELVRQAEDVLSSRGCRLTRKTLLDWIAHALMRLPASDRLLLHRRDVLRHSLARIAADLRITPFQAGLLSQRARHRLHEELTSLLAIFQSERTVQPEQAEAADPETPPTGRLVRGPWKPASGSAKAKPPSKRSPRERDHEVDGWNHLRGAVRGVRGSDPRSNRRLRPPRAAP
jgi:hypothetical protein